MKTRTGFVSNSSSSSFVFLGFEIDPKILTFDFFKEHDDYFNDGEGYLIFKCCGEILVVILTITYIMLNFNEFKAYLQKIKKYFKR